MVIEDTDRETRRPAVAVVAALGALGWFAMSADSLRDPAMHDYRDALVLAPWLMYGLVLVGVHQAQRHRTGRVALGGLVAALTGTALGAVGNVGVVLGNDAMTALAFPGGPAFFLAGLAVFGTATARAGVLPAWVGVLVALSQVNALVIGIALSWRTPLHPHGSYSGAIGHGAAMLAIAVGLAIAARRRHEG